MRTSCPNCGVIWGIDEMDWNNCYACGWPDNDDEYDDDYDPDEYDDDDERYDPNDSRNL